MPKQNAAEKRAVRERMRQTGENYTTALYRHREERAEKLKLCPCGCAARTDDYCRCLDGCECSPECGYCDADLEEEG